MKGSRSTLVVLLVVAIVATGLTRWLAVDQRRDRVSRVAGGTSDQSLGRMGSFTLALVLGGLRGPLAMVLWTTSENQKNEKNLEDIDTKIELIRMLQPEFDAVHLFQMWNKGYNLSVQMANLPNKYTTILDAIDYGYNVVREKPDNLNITFAIGDLLFSKLGDSSEKIYYVNRLREESLPPEPMVRISFPRAREAEVMNASRRAGLDSTRVNIRAGETPDSRTLLVSRTFADRMQKALASETDIQFELREMREPSRGGDTLQRTRFFQVLGEDHRVLPELIAPRREAQPNEEGRFNNGAELQYMTDFADADGTLWQFPYGTSPLVIAYSYNRRAEYLQNFRNQRHLQLGAKVVSSRPALALYKYAEEEWQRGRRLEIEAVTNAPAPSVEKEDRENVSTMASLDSPIERTPLVDEAIFSYSIVPKVVAIAHKRYQEHLRRFLDDELTYQAHLDWLDALAAQCAADAVYLEALSESDPARRLELARLAVEKYNLAWDAMLVPLLTYYVDDRAMPVLFPPGFQDPRNKFESVRKLSRAQRRLIHNNLLARLERPEFGHEEHAEVIEYTAYIRRAEQRVALAEAYVRRRESATTSTQN